MVHRRCVSIARPVLRSPQRRSFAQLASAIPVFRPGTTAPASSAAFANAPQKGGRGVRAEPSAVRASLRVCTAEGIFAEVFTAAGGAVLTACIAGAITTVLMLKQHDAAPDARPAKLEWRQVLRPLADRSARGLLTYQLVWSFAVGLAGSYFALHMLKNLEMGFTLMALHGAAVAGHTLVNQQGLRVLTSTARVFAAFVAPRIAEPGSRPLPELVRTFTPRLIPVRASPRREP